MAAALAVAAMRALAADLAQASPFLPAGSAATAAGASGPSTPVELRGIMATDGGVACCIYDTAKKTSTWVTVNEAGNDFVLKSIDPSGEAATVFYHGQAMKLALHESKVASAGSPPVAGTGTAPAVAPSVPTASDEQKRLDAVAAEVRRRRLEREKAYQGGPGLPGSTPPINLPPAGPNR